MKTLKILILFIILLSGCSSKYVADKEEELGGRKWSVLDAKVVEQDDVGFTLNLNVKDFVGVKDFVKYEGIREGIYKLEGKKSEPEVLKSFAGCLGLGCAFAGLGTAIANPILPTVASEVPVYMPDSWRGLCAGCGLVGLLVAHQSFFVSSKKGRVTPLESLKDKGTEQYYIKKNIVCMNSTPLMVEKVKIAVENSNFKKTYYTDEKSNVELSFDEIIPEPTEVDSILNLIIQYEELVDSVEVKRL